MPEEHGAPIAYTVLPEGTPVLTADGERIGTVAGVRADQATDVFDGIVVDTHDGERFVDAPEIDTLYERAVVLTITGAQARELPEPAANPAVLDVAPDDVAGDTAGDRVRDTARRVWDRLSGNY